MELGIRANDESKMTMVFSLDNLSPFMFRDWGGAKAGQLAETVIGGIIGL